MRKVIFLFFLALLIVCPAFSEEDFALTISGETVSFTEAEIYVINAEQEYTQVAEYYRKYLGIDYWTLTYANGMTVSEMIKSDVFDEIKSMNIFYSMAKTNGLTLTAAEKKACRLHAENTFHTLSVTDAEKINVDDLAYVFEKQRLADRMYSMCLLETIIDEEAVKNSVNRELYVTYEVEYLFRSFDDFDENGSCIPLSSEKRAVIERLMSAASAHPSLEEAALADPSLDILFGRISLVSGDESIDETLLSEVKKLSVGELSGVINTDHGLFLLKLTDNTDTAAYENALSAALHQARENAFSEKKEALTRECVYEINIPFWNTLSPGAKD